MKTGLLRLRLATHLFSNRVSHTRSPMTLQKTGSFTWWRTIQLVIHTISPTVISGVCRSPSAGMSAQSRWTILMVKNETGASPDDAANRSTAYGLTFDD